MASSFKSIFMFPSISDWMTMLATAATNVCFKFVFISFRIDWFSFTILTNCSTLVFCCCAISARLSSTPLRALTSASRSFTDFSTKSTSVLRNLISSRIAFTDPLMPVLFTIVNCFDPTTGELTKQINPITMTAPPGTATMAATDAAIPATAINAAPTAESLSLCDISSTRIRLSDFTDIVDSRPEEEEDESSPSELMLSVV
mmetsp:Transcript_11111/g.16895  ORF Transcript_11111/g.16895 Transcript_11111/m.16895 type:complete len:202 (-) Transcript_11111:268-873(-)